MHVRSYTKHVHKKATATSKTERDEYRLALRWFPEEAAMVSINGFYSAFMSGEDGQGYALLVFKDGNIVGADPLGVQFDGVYSKDGQGWSGEVTVKAPPGGTLIQGVTTGPSGIVYSVPIRLPSGFQEQPFIHIETPLDEGLFLEARW